MFNAQCFMFNVQLLSLSTVILLSSLPQQANASTQFRGGSTQPSTTNYQLIANQSLGSIEIPDIPPLGSPYLYLPPPEAELKNIRLVIRLRDRRVYVYQGEQITTSYPIAIGKAGWETPTGSHEVMDMREDPAWEHPWTGEVIPPGPGNPLGLRWIGFWTDGENYIGFHGTPNEGSVGQAASHGCIRMYNQDILALYAQVKVGTPVIVEP